MNGLDGFLPLLGSWRGVERQEPSVWGPATDARAALTLRRDVAGLVVVQDYRQVRPDGTEFLGHGVFLAEADRVLWWFFDSNGSRPEPAEGRWRADELELVKHTLRGTAVHRFRVAGEELEYRIMFGEPGTDLRPFLAGRYRQIRTH